MAARDARHPRLDVGAGRGHPLGRRPPQAPHLHRRGGRPAQPAHARRRTGWRGVLAGLWHSHMGWLFDARAHAPARRFAPRPAQGPGDPQGRHASSRSGSLLGLADPVRARLRALRRLDLVAGFTAFVWAGLVRVFLLHHATWSVNSICHMYGKQPVRDRGREPQQLGRRARLARRGLAPQPPRLPDLGPPRPPAAPVRPVLRAHPPVRAPRLGDERQAPEARADRGQAPRRRGPEPRPRSRPKRRRIAASDEAPARTRARCRRPRASRCRSSARGRGRRSRRSRSRPRCAVCCL